MFWGMEFSGFVLVLVVLGCLGGNFAAAQSGSWQLLLSNAGIASMHTAVTRFDTCIFLDRTNIGATQILLPNNTCRNNPVDQILTTDCYAHSVMFDPQTNTVRPLFIYTDTWCSSGQFFADGTLWQTGGDFEGFKIIRNLTPCPASGLCDWVELSTPQLAAGRWYASNQILPGGDRMIVVGGTVEPTYEFVPKRTATESTFLLGLLQAGGDNLYPYVSLLPDGNIWIFASKDSILLNYNTGAVLRTYPTIPGDTRNYPAAGSMVLLPLSYKNGFQVAEVLICGGATGGMNTQNLAQKSCGRMVVTDSAAAWAMEDMPIERAMGDMILLPDGNVLIINGAQIGSQGWGYASKPVFQPCLYSTNDPANRFQLLAATKIARMYHSTANLLSDGRILLAGSNTHQFYTYINTPYPTELRVEAFSPPYLSLTFANLRPAIFSYPGKFRYGRNYLVRWRIPGRFPKGTAFTFQCNVNSAPFVTHSYAQGQRQLQLNTVPVGHLLSYAGTVEVTAPPNGNVAPKQWYMMWVVVNGIPSQGKWVHITP